MLKKLLALSLFLFTFLASAQNEFTAIWNTNHTSSGSSANNAITIPTNPAFTTYNYTVDWGDGNVDNGLTGDITHTYAAQGSYTLRISGVFPAIFFNNTGDRNKIVEILQWGDNHWQTMENAFYGCENLNFDAIDAPNLSQVTSLANMFRRCTSFNGIVNNWNLSTITNLAGMFREARVFNRPLDTWNTSSVINMAETFYATSAFNEPLDNWNTASVTTMAGMFLSANSFNQNINNWNVGNVTDMSSMFQNTSRFNFPLNSWNVGLVTRMDNMFNGSEYNQPLSNWNVSNVTNMAGMFSQAEFNQPIGGWNVSNVTNMSTMFQRHRTFNQPLNTWDVSSVTNMSSMFDGYIWGAVFNQPLDNWDVSNVMDMSYMFRDNSAFNQPLANWDVSNVTNMMGMFSETESFNQDLSAWNVGNVTNMGNMFYWAQVFNQPLNGWNMANVTNVVGMFNRATVFNQPLDTWTFGNVTSLQNMFNQATAFNQDLSSWNTAMITNMSGTFNQATSFDRNLSGWNIANVTNMANMLSNSGLSQENYDNTLIGWSAQNVTPGVNLGAGGLQYCDALNQRQNLIDNAGWNITGDSVNCSYVLCTQITMPHASDTATPANSDIRWNPAPNATGYRITIRRVNGPIDQLVYDNQDVGNVVGVDFTNEFTAGDTVYVTVVPYNAEGPAVGCQTISFTVVDSWVNSLAAFKLTYDTTLQESNQTTPPNQLKIEAKSGLTYNYNIDWGDGQYDNNVTGQITHTYLNPGLYTVSIIGTFPSPEHNEFNSDSFKLLSIDQWGTQIWQSMEGSFAGCENMEYNATDVPNLTNVTDMGRMFIVCRKFNGNINNWDVSNVTSMYGMFGVASIFNQPLDAWDVSNVTNMNFMFSGASEFNQNINTWNTGNVTDMARMFRQATIFNQPLNNWDVSNVTNMSQMFSYATAFNQPLNAWNVNQVVDMEEMFAQATAFNQNINSWNVGNVTDMTSMFNSATAFNQPLNNWNVGRVTTMTNMFASATAFNQPLDQWNVVSVTNMAQMFSSATSFNQNINSWNVTNVIDMRSMFYRALVYNQPMNNWDVDSVVNMSSMFHSASVFNQPIDTWDVSAVANMSSMFRSAAAFDQPIGSWNVSSVTLMNQMFESASLFNRPLNTWNVASVTNMEAMFKNAVLFDQPLTGWNTGEALNMREMFSGATNFNQTIGSWNTSYVTTMLSMFENAPAFDQPIGDWNVASVVTMEKMFKGATHFNQDINAWNVRKVDTMYEMFSGAQSFNQSLNNWRVTDVSNMGFMFYNASSYNQPMDLWNLGNVNMRSTFYNATALNQYLGDWDVSGVNDMRDMLDNTALNRENYDNTLISWSEQNLTNGITLGAEGLPYCDALEERHSMITTFGWNIGQDVLDCPIPVCTQLTSPLNGATNVPVNTNLTWSPAIYARGYRLTVGTTPGGNNIVNNVTINDATSYEFAANFNTNATVYVTLVPFNDEGDAVGPCIEERFTIANSAATIPLCTSLATPLNGANNVDLNTDLTWGPISNADGYKLTLGTTAGGNNILALVDVGNVTSYEFSAPLPEDADIFVTITPYNDQGDAVTCSEERFHTELIPVPPVCTNLTMPLNNGTDVPIDTPLSWAPVANATGYLVIVGTTSGGIETVNNVDVGNATTYDIPEDLLENRTYFVTIVPYNQEGDAVGCVEETFRTGNSTSPPSCVSLNVPANGATNVDTATSISWNGSGVATGYRLNVGTTSGSTEIFTGDVGNVTVYQPNTILPQSATIYVTITPYNVNGDAVGCTEQSFTTNGPPACTTLLVPLAAATNIAADTSIQWTPSSNADGYKLTVTASNSTANNLTNFDAGAVTSYDFANNFTLGETVTVTIVPYNALGDANGCSPESFTIIPPPVPLCTALTSPTNGSLDIAPGTNITWTPSANAIGYRLTVTGSSSTANNLTNHNVTAGTSYDFASNFEQGETVTVLIVPNNAVGDAIGCTAESFTIKPVPACNSLIVPGDGAIDVAVDTHLSWTPVAGATGYRLSVTASSSTANNISGLNITTGTSYNFANLFEQGETVTVTLVPYNEVGDAIGCANEGFTIKSVPNCTALLSPLNNSIGVAADTNISWSPIAAATGYRLTVIGSGSTANNLTNFNVTGTSHDFGSDFVQGETVNVTIVPYNEVGDAIGCITESFTIKTVPTCTNLTNPTNGSNVISATEISWAAIADADGYKLTIVGSNSMGNNVTDLNLLGTTHIFPNAFAQGEVVTVTITPFNDAGDAMGCMAESFTIRPLPQCTNLLAPLSGATEVAVTTDITWNPALDADGYRISIGTTPDGNDLVNQEDVASLTSYTLSEDLPSETTIYVTIVPYNTSGMALSCGQESFATEVILPECTSLVSPLNGAADVPLESLISWAEVEKTDGYRLSLGTMPNGTDILNDQDMGLSTSFTPVGELPFNTEIFVTITPYNSKGPAVACAQQSFTTMIPEDDTKFGFSPDGDGVNEYWHIDNIEYYPENTVSIYNRWGDMVFQISNYDNTSNVFDGMANRATKLGARELPSGTYFFQIDVPKENILKKTQGFVVLKR